MKHLLLASLITLLAFGNACGQAAEPASEPVASDGIQVHGHWTVTVTNPDGTVDEVHEFDNDLRIKGRSVLTSLLSAEAAVSGWEIKVDQSLPYIMNALTCQESSHTFPGFALVPAIVTRSLLESGNPLLITGTCTITTPEPRMINIQVWDLNNVTLIDSAIKKSELGLNPQIDGQLIRLPVPDLSEERRNEIKKMIKTLGEKNKVSIRNIRREANDELKLLAKNKEISEDDNLSLIHI